MKKTILVIAVVSAMVILSLSAYAYHVISRQAPTMTTVNATEISVDQYKARVTADCSRKIYFVLEQNHPDAVFEVKMTTGQTLFLIPDMSHVVTALHGWVVNSIGEKAVVSSMTDEFCLMELGEKYYLLQ